MRVMRFMVVAVVCLLGLSVLLTAGPNTFGVADTRNISFTDPIRVGNVLLPTGNYLVQHTMEGENHIMVFTQLNKRKPVEARVKCQLVPLTVKADRDEKIYIVNASGERVLQTLIFQGDLAEHRF